MPNDLLASLDSVLDSVVAGLPDLGLEVKVDKLALLRGPLAIGVAVEDQLITASIADFDGGVREGAVGVPFDVVASRLGDEEWGAAALVSVAVKALLDGVVEDLARGDLLVGCRWSY